MQIAILVSFLLLLLVVNVPFLQQIFGTTFLSIKEWAVVIGLGLLPAVYEEAKKILVDTIKKD
jgi:NADH:ubiquinone oxidoreductase subunit K